MSYLKRLAKPALAIMASVCIMTGCATKNPNDPFENYNRVMFNVNEAFDYTAFKPLAMLYDTVMPDFAQTMVTNFFGNINDVWYAFNNILQGKGEKGMTDVARVMVNSLFGLGGVIDVASNLNMPKYRADFGQTLGVWGMEAGPYVVLPLLGPSTLRDTIALPAEWYGDAWSYVDNVRLRNAGIVVRAVNYRAALLDASSLVDDAALDKYEFMRDAYLQRRYKQVHGEVADTNDEWVELTSADPALKTGAGEQQTETIAKPVVTENTADSAIVKPALSENRTESVIVKSALSENKPDSVIVKPALSENTTESAVVKPVISQNETIIEVSRNESGKTDSVI